MAKIDSKHMRPPSCRRIVWVAYAKVCTILIPDAMLIYFSNGRLATKGWLLNAHHNIANMVFSEAKGLERENCPPVDT